MKMVFYILLSIQSLLCNNPLHNEPGFEGETGERNDLYNRIVEYDTYNHLIRKNGFEIHPLFIYFKPIIDNHFLKKKDKILNQLEKLSKQYNKTEKISLNIYNIMMIIDYQSLKVELGQKFKNLI